MTYWTLVYLLTRAADLWAAAPIVELAGPLSWFPTA